MSQQRSRVEFWRTKWDWERFKQHADTFSARSEAHVMTGLIASQSVKPASIDFYSGLFFADVDIAASDLPRSSRTAPRPLRVPLQFRVLAR